METTKPVFPLALKWAIIITLATFIFSIISYVTGMYLNKAVNWISTLILLGGLFLVVKERRDKDLGGYISFGQGYGCAMLVCLLVGIMAIATSFLMVKVIAPDMIENILRQAEQGMVDKGMSDDQIKMGMSYARKFTTPAIMSLFALLGTVVIGAIISLIPAAVYKKPASMLPPQ